MSTFVHMELSTSDVEAAKAFYQAVFGWQYHDMDMPSGPYTIVMAGDNSIGGMQVNPMPDTPNGWLGYVGVESVARTVATIESHGGTVLLPETDVGMGKLAIFTDPQGAPFAIWEPVMPAAAEPPPSEKQTSKKASKKKASKKAAAKAPEKDAPAKEAPAKKTSKKAPAKKASAKKAPEKDAPAKKATAKKAPAKKAPAKKASAKKASAKAPVEDAPAKKAPAKKAPAKKAGKK